jgi:uncharacterized protein
MIFFAAHDLEISLVDIPSEGLRIESEVEASDITLSSNDGEIRGSLNCTGQAFVIDDNLASVQGTLTGKVIRECVRCLMSFEEVVSLSWDAEFRQSPQSPVVPVPSKKKKKVSRRYESAAANEHESEIDTYPIIDSQIDLLPVLREHLILATPQQPLCYDECAGLCQVCGTNLNEGACGCCSPVTVSVPFVSTVLPVFSQKTTKKTSSPV